MAGSGKGAVFFALVGNGFLTIIKIVAFVFSGSGAMLSEAIHSFADTCNQLLLFLGIRRSQRPADDKYHYGYGADRFLFALASAAGIFVLGCGVTIYHGVASLFHPRAIELNWIPFAVLGISLVIEGLVLTSAFREVRREKGDQSYIDFIRTTPDPTVLAVLFEDMVAVLGVLVAGGGILLTYLTGNAVFDAVSSIIIGVLLGVVAVWLGWRNRQLILGPAIPKRLQDQIIEFLQQQPSVQTVRLVRTRIVGADRFRVDAEIDYNGRFLGTLYSDYAKKYIPQLKNDADYVEFAAAYGEHLLDGLGREVDRIEAELRKRFPKLRDVSLESDWNPDDDRTINIGAADGPSAEE